MAGCQIHRDAAPRLGAIVLSLVVHFAFIGMVAVMPIPSVSAPIGRPASADPGPVMSLAWEPPREPSPPPMMPPPPPPTPPMPIPPPAAQVPPPAIAQAQPVATAAPVPRPVPIPPPEQPETLKLGIADSKQESPNWIGFADPTEHKARQSTVEQPALDPNAGSPGETAMAAAPATPSPPAPLAPEAMPPERASPVQSPAPAPTPTPTAAAAQDPARLDLPPRDGPLAEVLPPEDAIQGQRSGPPPEVTSTDPKNELLADGPKREETLEQRPIAGQGGVALSFVGPTPLDLTAPLGGATAPTPGAPSATPGTDQRQRQGQDAAAPPQLVANLGAKPKSEPAPIAPPSQRPGAEASTPTPANQAPPTPDASISGEAGAKAAEQSEKESEATALEETIELRPGRPAASQGLEIFTRRPNFTGLTLVTANPRNPLVRVVFGSGGDVVNVDVLESSGARDIDEPVVNAVFLWTAKGPALKRIRSDSPTAGLSVKIRILLR